MAGLIDKLLELLGAQPQPERLPVRVEVETPRDKLMKGRK